MTPKYFPHSCRHKPPVRHFFFIRYHTYQTDSRVLCSLKGIHKSHCCPHRHPHSGKDIPLQTQEERERESMWERESWKVCSSYLKASSYIMLSFFIFFISTCKHWQKVQMVNMCTICWASFICHAVNYVLIRCHFSFTTKFTGAEDYQSARRTSAQYKL